MVAPIVRVWARFMCSTSPTPPALWSWATEPAVRRLQVEFGDQVSIPYVMGGLAREFREPLRTMRHVLDADHVHWLYDTTNRAELRAERALTGELRAARAPTDVTAAAFMASSIAETLS